MEPESAPSHTCKDKEGRKTIFKDLDEACLIIYLSKSDTGLCAEIVINILCRDDLCVQTIPDTLNGIKSSNGVEREGSKLMIKNP